VIPSSRGNTPLNQAPDECVLVVPACELDRLGRFQGFHPDAERYLTALLIPEFMSYRPRSQVETDPTLKQIIPYVVFRCEDAVFCYVRGQTQGEARLHRRRSLGVGGHVSEADAGGGRDFGAYLSAMSRELAEEVEVRASGSLRLMGLINDDATPVGQVHLGVIHLFELDRAEVHPRESGLADAQFLPVPSLRSHWEEFESWSQFCIDAFLDPR